MHVGSVQVLSALHVAVSDVEYPVAHVTAMPVPVADSTAEGVVPLAAVVVGHGSSVGNARG